MLVAAFSFPSVAANVKSPAALTIRLLNVAIPSKAIAVSVFEPSANVPLLEVTVTVESSVVTTLPDASSTSTVTGAHRGAGDCVARLLFENELIRPGRADRKRACGRCQ